MPHTTLYVNDSILRNGLTSQGYFGDEFPVYLGPHDKEPTYSASIMRIPTSMKNPHAHYEQLRWIYLEMDTLKKLGEINQSVRSLKACFIYKDDYLVLLKNPVQPFLSVSKRTNETGMLTIAGAVLQALNGLYSYNYIPPLINLSRISADLSGNLRLDLCANLSALLTRRLSPDESDKKEELSLLPIEQLFYKTMAYPSTMSKNTWQLGCLLVHVFLGHPAFTAKHHDEVHQLEMIIHRLKITPSQIEQLKKDGIINESIHELCLMIFKRLENNYYKKVPTLSDELQENCISKEAQLFILKLLDPNPNSRLRADDALNLDIFSQFFDYDAIEEEGEKESQNEDNSEQNIVIAQNDNDEVTTSVIATTNSPAAIFPQFTAETIISDNEIHSKIEQLLSEIRKFTSNQDYVFQSMSTDSLQKEHDDDDDDNEEQTRPKF